MNTISDIQNQYRQIVLSTRTELRQVQRRIYQIGSLRMVVFLAGIVGLICFRNEAWYVWLGIISVTFLPFVLLINYHNKLYSRKDFLEKKAEVNEQELEALAENYSTFEDGSEYIDSAHLYSYDLDVFGPHSLYQCINRSTTQMGRARLAAWFANHLETKSEIEQRQVAVRELTPELTFRQAFRIQGLLHKGEQADEQELNAWAAAPAVFRSRTLVRLLPVVVGALNAAGIVCLILGWLSPYVYVLLFLLCLGVSLSFTGRITKLQAVYGKKLQILATYATLLQLTEEQQMESPLLQTLKSSFSGTKRSASASIQQLNKLMHELDQRNNILMYVTLNGLFCWELCQFMRIEAWKEKYAPALPQWLDAIGQMDALNSLATFAYNHPDYVYPNIVAEPFKLCGTELGHPLMPRERCVRNDVEMVKRPFFTIITGANMAGKSTYLRAIGVNYLLACMGMPVCAHHFEVYPARLITSLRTTDSLNGNESYFFAEIKRLKLIIDALNAKENLFIILDEILKGTNSVDKQKGSLALIKQLVALQANGIIATHDLQLSSLKDSFPDKIQNNCFEADIANNELSFSYKMRPGVAQNMNACFLMKKMGIIFEED